MKTLGLIGGTSWVSTADYYKILNQEVNKSLGGYNSARVVLYSINFNNLIEKQQNKDFKAVEDLLSSAALSLKNAGADALMLGANTIHRYAEAIEARVGLPIIHIAKETAREIHSQGVKKAGLLGTMATMTLDFYKDILAENDISAMVPARRDQGLIHRAIFNELAQEIFSSETKEKLIGICNNLVQEGATGIILGCTELPLIIKESDLDVPVFDTLKIHALAGARFITDSE